MCSESAVTRHSVCVLVDGRACREIVELMISGLSLHGAGQQVIDVWMTGRATIHPIDPERQIDHSLTQSLTHSLNQIHAAHQSQIQLLGSLQAPLLMMPYPHTYHSLVTPERQADSADMITAFNSCVHSIVGLLLNTQNTNTGTAMLWVTPAQLASGYSDTHLYLNSSSSGVVFNVTGLPVREPSALLSGLTLHSLRAETENQMSFNALAELRLLHAPSSR